MYQAPKLFELGKVENVTLGLGTKNFDFFVWTYKWDYEA